MSISAASNITQEVMNGQLVSNTSEKADEKSQAQTNKDMFLQLLVAEMQYQDPLEPTDNSQYIQQLYSMSQTESVLAVQGEMEELTARNMVGKFVTVQDPVTGETFDGRVDSVADAGGGVFKISINGNVYDVGDVKQIHDTEYFNAVTMSDKLTEQINNLPSVELLRAGHKEDLQAAVDIYNNMNDYAKGFLDQDAVNKLTDLVAQMNILLKDTSDSTDSATDEVTEGDEAVDGVNEEAGGAAVTPEVEEETNKTDTNTEANQDAGEAATDTK